MGFRGAPFAFDAPDAAVAAMSAVVPRVPPEEAGAGGRAGSVRGADAGAAAFGAMGHLRGRVLAEDVRLDRDSPPHDHSAMDGFVVRMADLERGTLPILGEVRVGAAPPPWPAAPGVFRIVTGAAIPGSSAAGAAPAADPAPAAILKREEVTEAADGRAITLPPALAARVREGEHIRRRAENAPSGSVVLRAGELLTPGAVGALASATSRRPALHRRVRVTLITTGDELAPPGAEPDPHQIRNSNAPALAALLEGCGWLHLCAAAHVADSAAGIARALQDALSSDAVILTGGISMGHRDFVRGAVEEAGGRILFHGLPQRPGKPILGALVPRGDAAPCVVFGLPGNPLSALVTTRRIALPVLAACGGATRLPAPPRVRVLEPDGRTLDLWWHRPVRMDPSGGVRLVDGRGSGDVISGGRADGFIEVPPGQSPQEASYFPWSWG